MSRLPLRLLLRFSDPMFEERFLRFYESFYRRYAQASLLLGMILVAGDWLVDRLAYPMVTANTLRLSLALPILCVGLALSFTSLGRRYWQALMSATLGLVGFSLYWTLAQIGLQQGSGLGSWVGILNYTFFELYCFVILGIGFRYALVTGLLLLVGFEGAVFAALTRDVAQASYLSYHIVTVFLLAAMIGWWREYLLRKEFLAVADLEIATQAAQSQAAFLAGHDALTGLHNLEGFIEVLRREAKRADAQGQTLSLLVIDLGCLRRISDKFNLEAADQLMVTLVERLRQACAGMRPQPEFARTTSFEVAVMFRGTHGAPAVTEASERILDSLRLPFFLDGQDKYIQPSGGLALYPNDGNTVETALEAARIALTAHADAERFLHFYNAERDRSLATRLRLEDDLRGALAAGQFSLVYQPLVQVTDRVPVGVEALLRWTHPTIGQIGPAEFVPMAEELGIMNEIGEWVLNQACQQALQWQREGMVLTELAVNVSGLQLDDAGFTAKVASALAASGLCAQSLVLELTESVLIHENDAAMKQLGALKALGLRLALDDFGTGYSSMLSIARLPFDIIKIDRSFVQSAPHQGPAAAVVEAIIALATRLDLEIVAEGIETEEQYLHLVRLGCGMAQGYLFARPCAAQEVVLDRRKQGPVTAGASA